MKGRRSLESTRPARRQRFLDLVGGEWKVFRIKPGLVVTLSIALVFRLYIGLASWDALRQQDHGCRLKDQARSVPFEEFIYRNLLRLNFPAYETRQVAVVTLTEGIEPTRIFRDTCANRAFMSALIHTLGDHSVKVIAIDQSYSPDSCDNATINNKLRQVAETSVAPIVVGEHAGIRNDSAKDADCLVETPTFDFLHLEPVPPGSPQPASQTDSSKQHVHFLRLKSAHPANPQPAGQAVSSKQNVHFGLLRLNDNSLKIPLSWWIFPPGASVEEHPQAPQKKDGLALQTAKLAGLGTESARSLEKLESANEHPYADFVQDLPKWSAIDLLCYGKSHVDAAQLKPAECSNNIAHTPFDKLSGKVVFIGNHIDTDRKPFLDGEQYGVDLHAMYAEALLDNRFLRPAPSWLDDGSVFALLFIMVVLEFASIRWSDEIPEGVTFLISSGTLVTMTIVAIVLLKSSRELMFNFALTLVAIVLGLLPEVIKLFLNDKSKKNPVPGKV